MRWWTVQQFRAKNPQTRLAAVTKLDREEALRLIEPLGQLLTDADSLVRASAGAALAKTGSPLAVPLLGARLLQDPDATVRVALAQGLASMNSEAAIGCLVNALLDPAGEVGWHAARGLLNLRWQPANDTERASWNLAVNQFEDALACGPAALEPLIKLTRSLAFQRCVRAIEGLTKLGGSQAVKPVLECLFSQDFIVRSAAASALGELGDGRAFEPLVRALSDGQYQVCLAASGSLGKMGDQRAVEPLIKVLRHSAPDVRIAAIVALGRLRDPRAAGPVTNLLGDSDPDVREAAVTALGLMGNEQSIEPLVGILVDPQLSIRQAASYSLRRIETHWERSEAAARAVPKLQASLKSSDYRVRNSAAEALKKLGVSSERESTMVTDGDGAQRKRQAAHAILTAMLSDQDCELRQAASEALGRIGLASSIPSLVQRLSDADRGVRAAAARSLETLRWQPAQPREKARQLVALERWVDVVALGPEAVDALAEALAWDEPGARRRVVESLVRIGGPRAVATLRGMASDPAPDVREEARQALLVLESNRAPAARVADVWGEAPATS